MKQQRAPRSELDRELHVAVVGAALDVIVRWSRVNFYERVSDLTGVAVDRSAALIINRLYEFGPQRQAEISARLHLDQSTVSRQVKSVVDSGLATRVPDPSDTRAQILELTDLGLQTVQKLREGWSALVSELLSDLDDEQLAGLAACLPTLAARIEPYQT
jgi:DNA-binding MarR family transcriptional regulator